MRTLAAVAFYFVLACPVRAGVVFDVESRSFGQGQQSQMIRVFVEGNLIKTQMHQGQQGAQVEMIFRGDLQQMLFVDHRTQSYIVMDQQMMQQMGSQMNQAMDQVNSQMQQALSQMTPQQRAMAEQAMKGRFPGGQSQQPSPSEVRQVGDRATVYGYPSVLFEVLRDGRKVRNMWITDWKNIEGGRELAPAFAAMAEFYSQLSDSLPQLGQSMDNPFSTMNKLRGFPVAGREYRNDGTVESESALRSVKQHQLSPADFEPPAGFKQQQLPAGL